MQKEVAPPCSVDEGEPALAHHYEKCYNDLYLKVSESFLTMVDFMVSFYLRLQTEYKVVRFEGGTATLK